MKWAVAVTTAPRKECTLNTCLDSISICGWENIHIFSEPESTLPTIGTNHINLERLGVWRNWVQSVRWIITNTDAELILTVQDDSLFHPDSKEYVEQALWPSNDCGFISLYTPKHYTIIKKKYTKPPGLNRIITKSLWGACALVWSRYVLEQIVLEHPLIDTWLGAAPKSKDKSIYQKRKENPSLIANSDTAIGKIINSRGLTMWFVDPSPVQHIAKYSTISHGDNTGRRNCFRPADHSIPLIYQAPINYTSFVKK